MSETIFRLRAGTSALIGAVTQPGRIRELCKRRHSPVDFEKLLREDERLRSLTSQIETLRQQRKRGASLAERRSLIMRMHGRLMSLPALAGVALLLPMTARASIIFNNFGPANQYNANFGLTVSGASSGAGAFVASAMAFTPAGTFALTQIDVAIGFVSGTNSVALSLNSDSGGLPGGVIMSWTPSGLPAFGTCCTVDTVTPGLPVTLTTGTRYWIVASVVAANTWDAWNDNTTGSNGLAAQDFGSGFHAVGNVSAFDVLGNAVPEPVTTVLGGGGLALLAILRRYRRQKETRTRS